MHATDRGTARDDVLVDNNTLRAKSTSNMSRLDGSTAPTDTGRDASVHATYRHGHLALCLQINYEHFACVCAFTAGEPRAEAPGCRISDGGDWTGSGSPMVTQIADDEQ